MRVAVVTNTRTQVGGAETYVERVLGMLAGAGHDVLLLHEWEGPADRPRMRLPPDAVSIDVAEAGGSAPAIARLRRWGPTLIYQQGVADPALEASCLDVAPAVLFAHNYYGTCVSGLKTYRFPTARPCARRMGLSCLPLYYLRRTGGWNPVTMMGLYELQSARQRLLQRYAAILTFSDHMRREYLRHRVATERVQCLTFPLATANELERASAAPAAGPSRPDPSGALRLFFMGRLEESKGAHYLLEALPSVRAALQRTLRVTIAGSGPDADALRDTAARISAHAPGVEIAFVGWADGRTRAEILARTDLLVVPSVWPEPFGIVGLEAAMAGVPSVAFDVGGVRSWLADGETGVLAPGDPPTVAGLADAIQRAALDQRRLAALGRAALRGTSRFCSEGHLRELLAVFERSGGERRAGAAEVSSSGSELGRDS